jgi:hypothetical protein
MAGEMDALLNENIAGHDTDSHRKIALHLAQSTDGNNRHRAEVETLGHIGLIRYADNTRAVVDQMDADQMDVFHF